MSQQQAGELRYYQTAERPDLHLWLLDDDGSLIDFSTGYSFVFKIGDPGKAALFTKSNRITGAAGSGSAPDGSPNVVIEFDSGELDEVKPGGYTWQLSATKDGLDRIYQGPFSIGGVIL